MFSLLQQQNFVKLWCRSFDLGGWKHLQSPGGGTCRLQLRGGANTDKAGVTLTSTEGWCVRVCAHVYVCVCLRTPLDSSFKVGL